MLLCKTNADERKFCQLKIQFCQALYDNMVQRFPGTDFLDACQVLDTLSWPTDALERALYGEREVTKLCKQLGICHDEVAEILLDFAKFKKGFAAGPLLSKIFQMLAVYHISAAACERGFSQLHLQHTKLRNKLQVATMCSLLTISINGPPLEHWRPRKTLTRA